MKRSEYMSQYGTGTREQDAALHRAYYAQFVTDAIRTMVVDAIGEDRIKASTDPHFNDIPLLRWDGIAMHLPASVGAHLKREGDWLTADGAVCILKESAQQIREGK
jgi:hypothetical protein